MVNCSKLSAYYGNKEVFSNLNLQLLNGESITIKGSNGSGKSTLLKIIAGLKTPETGTVVIDGNISIAADFCNPYDELTVLENSLLIMPQEQCEQTLELLSLFTGVTQGDYFGNLSVGSRQKVRLAIALARNSELLILDEPSSGLDAQSRTLLYQLIKKQNSTLIIATNHQSEDVLCSRSLSLD